MQVALLRPETEEELRATLLQLRRLIMVLSPSVEKLVADIDTSSDDVVLSIKNLVDVATAIGVNIGATLVEMTEAAKGVKELVDGGTLHVRLERPST